MVDLEKVAHKITTDMYENGASAIFGPGTVIPIAAQKVIAELDRRHG
uniref:Uncharacterized protein n=1 Tax=Candidatus Kentrum sp. DK TaxID=2126562 RepID=A0A450TCC5_9GAMM|nr:MAG: hypothetical protein BECKDK2373B_GA0170837_113712 [Candidatus Kentron sp. DK]